MACLQLLAHWCERYLLSEEEEVWRHGRERGQLCNQLHQWLIIISMREISRHTEGLSKPPTLSIYLSFSSSSFQPLVFCLFAAQKNVFLFPVGRHDAFYISPHLSLFLSYLSHFLFLFLSPAFFPLPSSMRFCVFMAWHIQLQGRVVESLSAPKETTVPGDWALGSRLNC